MSHFAVVFPGQGSQAVGMLAELAEAFPVVQEVYSQASEVLGYDLWALVQQGPEAQLNQTHQTQPALLAASVAIWRVWQQQHAAIPSVMAGHSLGEYSALVCAGVIDFKDAIKLVALRGELMQEAVPAGVGAMSAVIGLDNDAIAKACDEASQGQVVSPVNFNSPGQVVIAGNKEAVERANTMCIAAGAKRAIMLPVSVPSHCALMQSAADKLAIVLDAIPFSAPSITVINNTDVATPTESHQIKEALIRQLYSPVRWAESVEKIAEDGVELIVEMGPGKILSGLIKRIDRRINVLAVNNLESLTAAKQSVEKLTIS